MIPGSMKPYKCTDCNNEVECDTNHYQSIVPFCKVCKKYTYHNYTGIIPEGGYVPQPFPPSYVELLNLTFPNGV